MRVPKGGVAFFDSGIGGLTVLSECEKLCPQEVFYYYGDHEHAPYGNLSEKKIKKYVFRVFRKFAKLKVKAVVVACNTATAVCIESLRKKYSFPIIGAEPAIFPAAKQGGDVYVLSTRATFSSRRFRALIAAARLRFPNATLKAFACDGLAGAIEENLGRSGYDFTCFLPEGQPSAVVLGCTHYIYIGREIASFYNCRAYDGNTGIARRLKAVLEADARKNRDGQPPRRKNPRFLGFSTTFNTIKKFLKSITKKMQPFWRKMSRNALKIKAKSEIYLLGRNNEKEAEIYKQMFAFHDGG